MELLGVCLHATAVQHECLHHWPEALAAHKAAVEAVARAGVPSIVCAAVRSFVPDNCHTGFVLYAQGETVRLLLC